MPGRETPSLHVMVYFLSAEKPVSYTHLDVYKRQGLTDGGTADLIVADQLVFRRDSVPNLVAVVFYIAENNIL